FKASLAEQMNTRTKDRLSKATLYSTLNALKRFFIWLAGQPGYRFRTLMPITSTCRLRRRGSPRPIGTRVCRPWSRSGTSSRRCRPAPRSSAAIEPSSPSPSDRHPRRGDRIPQAQAHRYRSGEGRPGRARGEDEVLEVVRALVLSGRRGYPPDRGRMGHLPAAGEALGGRRSAIPRNADRGWGQSAFRGIGPGPQALEQRRPYPSDFQGRLRGCGAAILQPAQLSEDLSPSGRTHLQVSRGVQGLVPEPRPRECSNDIF